MAAPQAYPKRLQSEIAGSLKRLLQKATSDTQKPQSFRLAVGGVLKKPPGAHASR